MRTSRMEQAQRLAAAVVEIAMTRGQPVKHPGCDVPPLWAEVGDLSVEYSTPASWWPGRKGPHLVDVWTKEAKVFSFHLDSNHIASFRRGSWEELILSALQRQ